LNHRIHATALATLGAGLLGLVPGAAPAEVLQVEVAWVGPTDGAAFRGAEQGIEEANRQGRFLGQQYRLVPREAEEIASSEAGAVVAAVAGHEIAALADTAGGRPVFNVGTTADADRSLCLPNLFHLQPSDSMKAAALAQWQAAGNEGPAQAVAWNAGFEKYAASQLNKRYAKTHDGEPMTDPAWAGWAAVKLYADAVPRVGTGAAAMVGFLRNDLIFDGQKGVDMTFRSSGQLRQLLLIERDGEVVGETPVRGKDLDSLGGGDCPPA